MAIILAIPGLEVTAVVHEQPLLEYDPLEDTSKHPLNTNTVVKFVESHDEVPFSVRVSTGAQYTWDLPMHVLRAHLHIDGKYVGNWIFGREEGCVCFDEATYFDFKKKEWLGRKMRFSAVKIVEEEAKPNVFNRDSKHKLHNKTSSALGTISVEMFRGIASDCPCPAEPIAQLDTPKKGVIEMEEKSLKGRAITHASTFSDPNPVAAPTSIKFEKLREDKGHPIASFTFLYRSREGLRVEGIIPSSSPVRAVSHSSTSNTTHQRPALRRTCRNATQTAMTGFATGIKIKKEPASDDEMKDQKDSVYNQQDKLKPTIDQHMYTGSNSRPMFPNRPRQTTTPAPARSSAFPYKPPAKRNTSNSSACTSISHNSSISAVSTPPSAMPTTSSSSKPRSLPPMFLKMQNWHKKQQDRAFMAAFSRIPSSTGPSRASSTAAVRSSPSPAVRSASPFVRSKVIIRKSRNEAGLAL